MMERPTMSIWFLFLKQSCLLLLVSICALGILGCGRKSDEAAESAIKTSMRITSATPEDEAGHARMLDVLKAFAEQAKSDHPILGDKAVRTFRAELQTLTPAEHGTPSLKTLKLHWQLGKAELRLGNLDQGIKHLTRAYDGLKLLKGKEQAPPGLALELAYQLGIAHMRRGETQNCCLRNSPDSCLLPIRGTGIHTEQAGSKQAIVYFMHVLNAAPQNSPGYLKAKWLLNIMYMTIDGYPDQVPQQHLIQPSLFESDEPFPRFKNIAHKLGVDTFSLLGGAIVDDFTGDGYLDIVASTYDPNEQMRFFRNNQDGTFTDRTEEANLNGLAGGFNLLQADYDNDGDLDILMLRGGWQNTAGKIPNSLLRNNGEGRFIDVTFNAGLGDIHYPTQTATWADYDNDGDVDLYIGNEALSATEIAPCQLFRNNGDGTFTDVARQAGVLNLRFTKGVTSGDYDADGFPDLYVSNMGAANRLYRNNGDETFTDVAVPLQVTGPIKSFPVWFWDFNNDGILDIFVASNEWDRGNLAAVVASWLGFAIKHELAYLYQGDGEGGFNDVAKEQHLTKLHMPMGVNFGDLDNDGFLDFYLGTGYPDYEALMPNVMYRNRGGKRFSDVTSAGGFGHLQKGHGIVFADLDNDGDQDLFQQIGGFLPGDKYFDALFENPGFGNHWITVKLVGVRSNRSAIGARIHVKVIEDGRARSIYKHVNSGGSFGANPLQQTIGLGKSSKIERLDVYWPTTGQTQSFRNLAYDQIIEITEAEDRYTTLERKTLKLKPESVNGPDGRTGTR
jgi:hypothetical protein